MTKHSSGYYMRSRGRPEHRSRRRHLVKRNVLVVAAGLVFNLFTDRGIPFFRMLLGPGQEVEDEPADKHANPEDKFGSVYDHAQDLDVAFAYCFLALSLSTNNGQRRTH